MATSNSTIFELTRDQIIAGALRKLGVLAMGESPSADQTSNAQLALNGMVALFVTDGMPLWKRITQTVFLDAAETEYTITNAVKVLQVLREDSVGNKVELIPLSLYDYNQLPVATGTPLQYSFTPNITEGGTMVIWPQPDSTAESEYTLSVVAQKEFDTFTGGSETPDFPSYWSDSLVYGLASRLAPEYGIPLNDRAALRQEAEIYHQQALFYSGDDNSIFFQPGFDY